MRRTKEQVQVKTQGLIIREQPVGESDRLVTVLTKDEGVVRAFARRAKNLKDSKNSATGLLCYSRLNLYRGREKYIINDAFPIEVFFGLRRDIVALALGQYFCSLAAELVPEGVESGEYLRLVLNALHFLCEGKKPLALLKPVVELRMLSVSGFMPDLVACSRCGAYEAADMFFRVQEANLCCGDCGGQGYRLSKGALTAMRHIIYSPIEKLFSFTIGKESVYCLNDATERFLIDQTERTYQTLTYFHSVKISFEGSDIIAH